MKKYFLSFIITIVGLVLFELIFRYIWDPNIIGVNYFKNNNPTFGFGFKIDYPLCPEFKKEFKCFQRPYFDSFYDQAVPILKKEKHFRIINIGGSISAGADAYPQRILNSFNGQYKEVIVDGLNLSQSGYGTKRMLEITKDLVKYKPDVLVIDPTGTNEYEDNRDFQYREIFFSSIYSILHRSFIFVHLRKKFFQSNFDGRFEWWLENGHLPEREARKIDKNFESWHKSLRNNLTKIIAVAREHKIPMILVGRSIKPNISLRYQIVKVNEIIKSFKSDDIMFFDTMKLFDSQENNLEFYDEEGYHYYKKGHQFIAKQLAELISNKYILQENKL